MTTPQAPQPPPTTVAKPVPIEAILHPLGLVTQPNKLGYYDNGALSTASGVYVRDPGVITTQQAFVQQLAGPWAGLSPTAFELIPVDRYSTSKYMTLYLNSDVIWRWALDNTGQGTITYSMNFPTSSVEAFQSGTGYQRIGGWTLNGLRLVVPGVTCTHVFDMNPAGAPTVRPAGLPKPIAYAATLLGSSGVITAGKYVHYVAVQRRVFADNVELVSAPSAALFASNPGGADQNFDVLISLSSRSKIGDYVDLYKTRQQTNSTVNTGSDYYLCASQQLTINGHQSVTISDRCNDVSLGAALYTNSGVRGAAAGNDCPPICKSVCTFKGYTFFLGPTELSSITLRVGSGMFQVIDGTAAVAGFRANGIGTRYLVGNCTNGGNTITAVSAADMSGIVVGQLYNSGPVGVTNTGMHVSAASGSTITLSGGTFTGSSTGGTFVISDVIQVDGQEFFNNDFNSLINLAGSFWGDFVTIDCLDRVLPPAALLTVSVFNGTIPADSFSFYRPCQTNNSNSVLPMTIRATNGNNYTPRLPRIEAAETALTVPIVVRKNMIRWSEQNNADAAPRANSAFVGSGEIYAAYAMRDCMLIFASDGCWRLSGTGGQAGAGYDWRIDPIDSTLILSGPRCGCVARDTFFGYTNRGFVSVDSSGSVREISQRRVQDLMPGPPWSDTQAACAFFDEANDEVVIKTELSTVFYVYNILTDAFTTLINAGGNMFDGAFIRADQRIATINASGIYAQSGAFSGVASQVDYQPVYGANPFAMQQWQSMDLVFDAANVGLSVTPRFNAAVGGTARALAQRGNDQARAAFSVGRNTPAKATCIAPGWSVAGGLAQLRFFGAALRKVAISFQREQR